MQALADQVVIVTGAASGIGYAIATRFAEAGATVGLADLDGEKAQTSAENIAIKTGANVLPLAVDVCDQAQCNAAFSQLREASGPATVLINNAGIMPQQKGFIEDLPPEHFEQMMAIHVTGALNWARAVLPDMRAANYGRIINVSSANALLAVPHRLGYVTAKTALLGMTKALALDTARAGITANALVPGYVLTDTLKARADSGVLNEAEFAERTPVGRWGAPEEIAHAAAFLADPASGFITGSTLVVDGGITIRGDPGENLDFSPMQTA